MNTEEYKLDFYFKYVIKFKYIIKGRTTSKICEFPLITFCKNKKFKTLNQPFSPKIEKIHESNVKFIQNPPI